MPAAPMMAQASVTSADQLRRRVGAVHADVEQRRLDEQQRSGTTKTKKMARRTRAAIGDRQAARGRAPGAPGYAGGGDARSGARASRDRGRARSRCACHPGRVAQSSRQASASVDNTTPCAYLLGANHSSTYPNEEMIPMANFKVADLKLADKGKLRIEWAEIAHAGAHGAAREVQGIEAAQGPRASPAACTSPRRPPSSSARCAPPAPRSPGRAATRCRPRTTSPRRSPPKARRSTPGTASTRKSSTGASTRRIEFKPTLTLDDGADLIFTVHAKHPELAQDDHRRHRGDHHRRAPPARHGRRRQAAVPGHRHQRLRDQVGLRQRLRHRASRRSTASCAPRRCSSPARPSSSPASATAARGVADARQGHGRQRRRAPRSSRPPRSRRRSRATA